MKIIKTVGSSGLLGRVIPGNEKWLHKPDVKAELDEAIAWAKENPPRESNLEELEARVK